MTCLIYLAESRLEPFSASTNAAALYGLSLCINPGAVRRCRGLLTIRTLIAKLTGIVFAIGAGIIAGKEGPFVHGGAIVGGGIGGAGSM